MVRMIWFENELYFMTQLTLNIFRVRYSFHNSPKYNARIESNVLETTGSLIEAAGPPHPDATVELLNKIFLPFLFESCLKGFAEMF